MGCGFRCARGDMAAHTANLPLHFHLVVSQLMQLQATDQQLQATVQQLQATVQQLQARDRELEATVRQLQATVQEQAATIKDLQVISEPKVVALLRCSLFCFDCRLRA